MFDRIMLLVIAPPVIDYANYNDVLMVRNRITHNFRKSFALIQINVYDNPILNNSISITVKVCSCESLFF